MNSPIRRGTKENIFTTTVSTNRESKLKMRSVSPDRRILAK